MISVFRPHFQVDPLSNLSISSGPISVESLTRDVHLKPIHSHNDYWRARPLLDALLEGCVSVESDIWHFKEDYTVSDTVTATTESFSSDQIYVGHNQIYLHPQNTLDLLYFDTIYEFLESANKQYSVPMLEQFGLKFGLFYDAPEEPLNLWLDLKTEGNDTYTHLKKYLTRFSDKSYLSRYDTDLLKRVPGPVVVTLTGNVPWALLGEEQGNRTVFADCPLQNFTTANDADWHKYEKMCVFASASLKQLLGADEYTKALRNDFTDSQKTTLKSFFDAAHAHGIKTRIWGGVDWPNFVRDAHWTSLWELGCDLINADDLAAAANVF